MKIRWIVLVGVLYSAWVWYLAGYGSNGGLLNEMRARQCWRKECRIFFLKCHVVKLWRVLYYFQEERLNSLPFNFFSCLHPSPCRCCCTSGVQPLGGSPGQWIGQTACRALIPSIWALSAKCEQSCTFSGEWLATVHLWFTLHNDCVLLFICISHCGVTAWKRDKRQCILIRNLTDDRVVDELLFSHNAAQLQEFLTAARNKTN